MELKPVSSGKVRNIYDLGNELLLETTDRMSAFDVILQDAVPKKGIVLNQLSAFWFNFMRQIVKNHMITVDNANMPEQFQTSEFAGRCMLVRKLKMLPVECIVRGYITGSGWANYKEGKPICGIHLPEGLQESQQLPNPIFTPTTKAEQGQHDENITFDQLVEMVGLTMARNLRQKSLEIYYVAAQYAKSRGIIIADTKFEFGLDDDGHLVLADEVLTPDSSRFWPAYSYIAGQPQPSFDKQYLRDWLNSSGWNKQPPAPKLPIKVIETTSTKYVNAYEMLTNRPLFF